MPSCSWSMDGAAEPGWTNSTMCPGVGQSIALPGPVIRSELDNKFLPSVPLTNASIVVIVSAIGACSGNFSIGACPNYGTLRTIHYDVHALSLPSALPLVVVAPGQCVQFKHHPVDNNWRNTTACDGFPVITAGFALIGDFCLSSYATETICDGHNTQATTPPSSGAPTQTAHRKQWKRTFVVAAMVAIATVFPC